VGKQAITADPPVYIAPSQPVRAARASSRDEKYQVVGTGTYFFMALLFAIPFLGWIICLVTAFAAKRLSLRNYARAMLILLIIGLIMSIALYFMVSWAFEAVLEYINENTLGALGGAQGISSLTDLMEFTGNQ
jgi:cellulose synthase/poly-beta-1,6-N-acetylglucosamine synthase-like glycosyltransferase